MVYPLIQRVWFGNNDDDIDDEITEDGLAIENAKGGTRKKASPR
jgi:hypothetical protein